VKAMAPVVPSGTVIVTAAGPGIADAATVNRAVICVALATTKLEIPISGPALIEAGAANPVPVSVTCTAAPGADPNGAIADTDGPPACVTVNACPATEIVAVRACPVALVEAL
jgi:hypothetical protein